MKMAKANEADLAMANELAGILDSLEERRLPDMLAEQFGEGRFDIDNREHCREAMGLILNTVRKASLFRVTFGMLVLLDPDNELVDPDAPTLEVHPKFERCEQARARLEASARRLVDVMERSDVEHVVANNLKCPSTDEWDEAIREAKAAYGEAAPAPEFLGDAADFLAAKGAACN